MKVEQEVVYKFIYRRFDQNWKNVYYELFSYQTGNVHEIGKVFFDNVLQGFWISRFWI